MNKKKKNEKVLITGGAGCVGSIIVELLANEGYDVVCLDREGSQFPDVNGIKILKGDIRDKKFVESSVCDVDYVINTAAIVDISKGLDELLPTNFYAVKTLYEAAKTQGVRGFIHFSTGSVYDISSEKLKEDHPTRITNPYVQSKLMADEYLLSQKESPPVVNILRPALIFGPKGRVLAGALAAAPVVIKLFTQKLPELCGGAVSNWVHANDVARAAVFLMKNPQKHGEIFNVANDDPRSFGEILTIAFRNYGIEIIPKKISLPPKPLLKILDPLTPSFFFKALNAVTAFIWGIYMKKKNLPIILFPKLDKEAMSYSYSDTIFDNSKLKSLGFTYEYPDFEKGWKDTIKWYIENGWIPSLSKNGGQG